MTEEHASLARGASLGRYEVESLLGAGGMGEVYLALDRTLGRRVALKVLPPDCTNERVLRFQREAQASSALNHPAIVSVYDAGCIDGVHFLAMELIDGEPLSRWLESRRNIHRGVDLMAQVAEGLARAHESGIVHRDLKPDNIMVGREGHAKIVDFGIAKLKERDAKADAATELKTQSGSVVGTVTYMSPEQASARDVDYRSDIFSFGTVLFEVLTGRRAFSGATAVDVMHNILHTDPPFDLVPAEYRRIVRRCMAKEPERRYHSMKDVALDLREVPEAASAKPANRALWPWAAAIVAALAVIAIVIATRRTAPAAGPNQAASPVAAKMVRVTNSGNVTAAAISPDGLYVVYSLREGLAESLWVKQLSSGTARRMTEPQSVNVQQIAIAPDGAWVYYASSIPGNSNHGQILQVPILGGEPRRIADDTEFVLSVSPDGKRVAFRRFNSIDRIRRLTVVDIESGNEKEVFTLKAPVTLPSLAWSSNNEIACLIADPGKFRRIEEISVINGKRSVVRDLPWIGGTVLASALPDGSGFLVSASDPEQPAQIWFVPRKGEPRVVTSDISAYYSATPTADSRSFAALRGEGVPSIAVLQQSSNGMFVPVASGLGSDFNVSGLRTSNVIANVFVATRGISWLDATHLIYTGIVSGHPALLVTPTNGGETRQLIRGMPSMGPSTTPDGTKVLFTSMGADGTDAWAASIDGRNPKKVTDAGSVFNPVATPDGRYVYYATMGASQFIWRVPFDGGPAKQITTVPTATPNLSADGKLLLCRLRWSPPGQPALWRTAIVDPETGKLVRFCSLPLRGGSQVRWHPSSKKITAVDGPDGIANLWQEDLASGETKKITNFDRGVIYAFDWSRDGKSIAVLHGEPRSDAVIIRDFK